MYQECLTIEFRARGIPYVEKPWLQIHYKEQKLEKEYKPDFLLFDKIVLEIKAMKDLDDVHHAQVHDYLKVTRMHLGLLVNFGHYPKLQYERIVK